MEQLILHLFGDYVVQSDWMAIEKTKTYSVALVHALTYGLPFLLIGSWQAVGVIVLTHAVIDRFRLARYLCWVKNLASPKAYRFPWSRCSGTGYNSERPPWLAVWLMIVADNVVHLAVNYVALRYL